MVGPRKLHYLKCSVDNSESHLNSQQVDIKVKTEKQGMLCPKTQQTKGGTIAVIGFRVLRLCALRAFLYAYLQVSGL